MDNLAKKHRKKTPYATTTLLIVVVLLLFFTRHLQPTSDQPTQEALALTPHTSSEILALQPHAQQSDSKNSTPVTSIPAAEAWVLNT